VISVPLASSLARVLTGSGAIIQAKAAAAALQLKCPQLFGFVPLRRGQHGLELLLSGGPLHHHLSFEGGMLFRPRPEFCQVKIFIVAVLLQFLATAADFFSHFPAAFLALLLQTFQLLLLFCAQSKHNRHPFQAIPSFFRMVFSFHLAAIALSLIRIFAALVAGPGQGKTAAEEKGD